MAEIAPEKADAVDFNVKRRASQGIPSCPAPPYGFSKYSGGGWEMRTKPPSIRHPGSFRAFRDVHVPEFLDIGRNIRKPHMPPQDDF